MFWDPLGNLEALPQEWADVLPGAGESATSPVFEPFQGVGFGCFGGFRALGFLWLRVWGFRVSGFRV